MTHSQGKAAPAGTVRSDNDVDEVLVGGVPPVILSKDGGTALLIIDMQYDGTSPDYGFNLAMQKISPGSADYVNERAESLVLPTIIELLTYFRENGLPVVHVAMGTNYRDYRDVPGRWREWIRGYEQRSGVEDIIWAQDAGFAIRAELAPTQSETVIQKVTLSAFNSSDIDRILREQGITDLVVTGVVTSACVETTARDAADLGYGCVIVDEGTADYDEEVHRASLRAFSLTCGKTVTNAADVISAMENSE